MMITSVSPPTITQTLLAMNNPQPVNIKIGPMDFEAGASCTSNSDSASSSGSVSISCGGSVNTSA